MAENSQSSDCVHCYKTYLLQYYYAPASPSSPPPPPPPPPSPHPPPLSLVFMSRTQEIGCLPLMFMHVECLHKLFFVYVALYVCDDQQFYISTTCQSGDFLIFPCIQKTVRFQLALIHFPPNLSDHILQNKSESEFDLWWCE